MVKEKGCPCKECIVFPLCKARLLKSGELTGNANFTPKPLFTYGITGMIDREDCKMLKKYIFRDRESELSDRIRLDKARVLFGLEKLHVEIERKYDR